MTPCPELHIPHKEWSGQREELENYVAIERWARTRGCGEACSCYVEHRETTQTIPTYDGFNGARPDPVLIDPWSEINSCGTLSDESSMLMLVLNWQWQSRPSDPFSNKWNVGPPDYNQPMLGGGPAGGGAANVPNARFVGVYGEGMSPAADNAIAIDTRLGLGDDWLQLQNALPGITVEGGSISVALNLFPAGQGFNVWVAQNTSDDLDIFLRADLYTVCGCACVL